MAGGMGRDAYWETTSSSASALPSLDCWDYTIELECLQGPEDLQLAAELGKTLLERNKELETTVKQQQNVIEDKSQEIEYLTKQTAALREVNDSRLRIYEQLEVSILDLERSNQRLSLDSAADKKHIKTLCVNIDSLEARCEEYHRQIEELKKQADRNKPVSPNTTPTTKQRDGFAAIPRLDEEVDRLYGEVQELKAQRLRDQRRSSKLEEQVQALEQENNMMAEQLADFQKKEDEMKSLQEEITTLEEIRRGQLCGRCSQKMESRGPIFDSLHLLEQSSAVGARAAPAEDGDDEDVSLIDSFVSDSQRATLLLQLQDQTFQEHSASENPYRDLVRKYEALVEIQANPICNRRSSKPSVGHSMGNANTTSATNALSLQEELQMSGDFNSFRNEDDESGNEDHDGTARVTQRETSSNTHSETTKKANGRNKAFSTTPTDFSEAETSSSGFSDEISNKATQTGSFLCTIEDGDDCRFSIYDNASRFDSRFRNIPEYRSLFREIFDVLKRAAEAKDEGGKLPLLDDTADAPRVPPGTPAKEELPLLKMLAQDGTQTSILSEQMSELCSEISSEIIADSEVQSMTAGMDEGEETSTATPASTVMGELAAEAGQTSSAPAAASASTSGLNADIDGSKSDVCAGAAEPKPASPAPKRDIMEYLSMGLGNRKKGHSRKNSPHGSPRKILERIDPATLPILGMNTKVSYSKGGPRRKRDRHAESPSRNAESPPRHSPSPSRTDSRSRSSSGHRNMLRGRKDTGDFTANQASSSTSTPPTIPWTFKPSSSASQELNRLIKLDMSYADVLRKGPRGEQNPMVSKFTQVHYRSSHPK